MMRRTARDIPRSGAQAYTITGNSREFMTEERSREQQKRSEK